MEKLNNFYAKHKKILIIVGAALSALMVLSVFAQLLYPSGKTLPGQKIGGQNMGFQTAASLKNNLSASEKEMQLTIGIGDKKQPVPWHELGITIDRDTVVSESLSYSWPKKLIPFSSVYRILANDVEIAKKVDEDKLKTYSERLSAENYQGPANASLSVSGATVVRNKQKAGSKYEPAQIAGQIKVTPYKKGAAVQVVSTDVPPAFAEAEIESMAKKAEAIIATEIKVEASGKTQTVPPAEIAFWLKFTETDNAQHIAIDINKEKVKAYISPLNKDVYRAPGKMTITLRDGKELGRTPDTSGQSLDMDNGANSIAAGVLEARQTTVKVPVIKLPPKITYQRSYSKSQAGMSALLNDLVAEEADMSISLRALDGSGIVASAKGGKQYAPASTYKLPVTYSAIKRIEAGTLQWTDDVNGRNVEKCISDMIVLSDNPCASALGDKLGWQAITDDARSIGMGGTNLARGFVSTSNDQAIFLSRLQQGSLMNTANRDRLLDLMKQQRYRSGVPAGTNGAVVANKPGFINGLLHDSAIVYGPKGTYVLVIYSDKSSWQRLASATAKIHALMNQ